jgi:exopolysaccharide biosynthesis protein
MDKNKGHRKKIKFSWKTLIIFLAFEIVFTGVTGTLILFYGPFQNVKKTVVGMAMTTLTHQYIATTFLSKAQIAAILSTDKVEAATQNSVDSIKAEITSNATKHDTNIERYDIVGTKFKGYLLIIKDPTRVKVGYTKKLDKEGELTSQIAKDNNAVAAINGGGFLDSSTDGLWTGTGGTPVGLLMSNGKTIHSDIRGDDTKVDVMAITKDGILLVGTYTINEMKKLGVAEAISFGPALVVNGAGTIRSGDGGWGISARTAVGQRKDGAIMLLVIDGRQVKSLGASLREVQDIMLKYGAISATNLDGGSSATMYYDGDVINNPCDSLGERYVPSAIYVEP